MGSSNENNETNEKISVSIDATPNPHPSLEEDKPGFFARLFSKKSAGDEKKKDEDKKDEDKKEPEVPPIPFYALFRFSTKFELMLDFIGLIAAIVAGSAQPLMTLLFGKLTQEFINFQTVLYQVEAGVLPDSALEEVAVGFRKSSAKLATYLVYMGLGILLATFVFMYNWSYTGEVNAKRIRERYLRAVLRQDIAFFDQTGAGEITTRIQTDTHMVQQGMSEKVALIVSLFSAFLVGFILAFYRSWRLALALTSIIPCIMITGGVMATFATKYSQLSLKHTAEAGSLAEEVFSTVRTSKALGIQNTLSGLYAGHITQANKVDMRLSITNGCGFAVFFFVVYASYALAFSFGTTLMNKGLATPDEIINVFLAILIGSFSLGMMAPEVQAITQGCGAAAKLYATIDRVPSIDSGSPSGLKPSKVEGIVQFSNVKFNYPSRPTVQILKGLSITFNAGKTAALVGASGSGKSTIVSLIERFYDPLEGEVLLDGVDIKELNVKWLRGQIGLVSQEPVLFGTTIMENVAYGLIGTDWEGAPKEEKAKMIEEACVKANAHGFISKLPQGYETMVGERGFLLSGGQKQRIAIARAIVSDPRILLLDEATSALDTQSEEVVQNALDKASEGRTTIVIAHRLSTIKDADVIYVMGDGQVLERGTHSELIEREGPYSILVNSQRLREEEGGKGVDPGVSGGNVIIEEQGTEEVARRGSVSSTALREKKELAEKEKVGDHGFIYLFKRMGLINRESWKLYGIGVFFSFITGAAYPAFGIVFSQAMDFFASEDPKYRRREADKVALWLFIIALGSAIGMGMQNYLFGTAAARLTSKLRVLSFRAIVHHDVEYFDRDENSTGKLTANLSEHPQKINGLAGATLAAILQSTATIILGTVLGLVFVWKIALVALACLPLLLSTGYIHLQVVVLKDQANKTAHEESAQMACEAASSIRTVASLTREDNCLALYSKSLEGPLRHSQRTGLISYGGYGLTQAIMYWVMALIFWFGSRLVSNREVESADFFIGLMSTTFAFVDAGQMFAFVPDMSSAKGSAQDVLKLIDAKPEIDEESNEGVVLNKEKVQGRVELSAVHFRYPTRPGVRVLRELSITAEPGTFVALVGESGCGKSTVIQLLERFYDPLSGKILFDGQSISELNVQEYRKHIALVSQEPTLYAGTVRFNILLGATKPKEEVTQEEIDAACRDANILEFIQGLPDGFETQVGGKGSQLSGGQKQRIAIARALLRNPKVLLLDEATSALDSNSEKVVQEALDQAMRGRTTIAIAHRLSTIQNADKIYFIKEGRVSEVGTHDQLFARRGDYYAYVQLQNLAKQSKE